MKKILIATKNKDKFEIVTKILDKINDETYQFYSLYDIPDLVKDEKEVGNIKERAFAKANQIYTSIKEKDFAYIIGIDDGIKMKGSLKPNVKDYMKDIIEDKYLTEGESVEIVRAYCCINQEGKSNIVITEIPFTYSKYEGSLKIEANSYPLSNVLKPLNVDKTVAQMSKEENNQYYLQYSEKQLKEIFI
ncbi:MAG: hypothetical protein RR751_03555 [Clostridia bacterium]